MPVFAIICYAFFPIVFCLYPETSRRTLEDMDEIFFHSSNLIVCGDRTLTQRERPQLFIDAETRRVDEGANAEAGTIALEGKVQQMTSHIESVA